jgi:SOS-response transcriptional repressor LexA
MPQARQELTNHWLHHRGLVKSLPGNKLQALLRRIGCDVELLMTGGSKDEKIYRLGTVPFLGRTAANPIGKKSFEESEDQRPIPFFEGNFFALIVEGDSLINAPSGDHSFEIYPGDIVIFQAGMQPTNGDIVAVQLKDNRRMVKILKHLSRDEVDLQSPNKFRNYPAILVKKSQIARFGVLAGRVTLSAGDRRRLGIG